MEEAQSALARLLNPPRQIAVGNAYYQIAELHRLQGQVTEAEEVAELA
jgi:hypothetical protein